MSDFKIKNTPIQRNVVENSTTTNETTEDEKNINIFGFEVNEETLNTILTGTVDVLLGDGAFTKDEATIFVTGEKEIEELIRNAPNEKNLVETILDQNKTEREIREKYLSEHPEYAAVMKEGQNVQKKYDETREKTRLKWIDDNPPPEMMKKGGLLGMTVTDEYKDWYKKQAEFMNDFEKEYIQNNSDYAHLKEEQDKDKDKDRNIIQILFGL